MLNKVLIYILLISYMEFLYNDSSNIGADRTGLLGVRRRAQRGAQGCAEGCAGERRGCAGVRRGAQRGAQAFTNQYAETPRSDWLNSVTNTYVSGCVSGIDMLHTDYSLTFCIAL